MPNIADKNIKSTVYYKVYVLKKVIYYQIFFLIISKKTLA